MYLHFTGGYTGGGAVNGRGAVKGWGLLRGGGLYMLPLSVPLSLSTLSISTSFLTRLHRLSKIK